MMNAKWFSGFTILGILILWPVASAKAVVTVQVELDDILIYIWNIDGASDMMVKEWKLTLADGSVLGLDQAYDVGGQLGQMSTISLTPNDGVNGQLFFESVATTERMSYRPMWSDMKLT